LGERPAATALIVGGPFTLAPAASAISTCRGRPTGCPFGPRSREPDAPAAVSAVSPR